MKIKLLISLLIEILKNNLKLSARNTMNNISNYTFVYFLESLSFCWK